MTFFFVTLGSPIPYRRLGSPIPYNSLGSPIQNVVWEFILPFVHMINILVFPLRDCLRHSLYILCNYYINSNFHLDFYSVKRKHSDLYEDSTCIRKYLLFNYCYPIRYPNDFTFHFFKESHTHLKKNILLVQLIIPYIFLYLRTKVLSLRIYNRLM